MDVDMKNSSLDDLIKRDKKMGRVRQANKFTGIGGRGTPLPGRGRGGARGSRMPDARRQAPGRIQKNRPQNNNQPRENKFKPGTPGYRRRENRNNDSGDKQLMGRGNNRGRGAPMVGNRRQTIQKLRQRRDDRRYQRGGHRQNLEGSRQNAQRDSQRPAARQEPQQRQQNQQNNQQDLKPALSLVQGTLAQRKLKVRGIDARQVTQKDLQKLFGKCGPIITASFDTNEYGAYLGSATIIYSKASCADRAIKDYNQARIDNRPMRVEYALQASIQLPSGTQVTKPQRATPTEVRRTGQRIQKNRVGRTLNVKGNGQGGRGGRKVDRQAAKGAK